MKAKIEKKKNFHSFNPVPENQNLKINHPMTLTRELAEMIDHSILHPTLTDEDLKKECDVARKYKVASVCVKPYAVPLAVEFLKGFGSAGGVCHRLSGGQFRC